MGEKNVGIYVKESQIIARDALATGGRSSLSNLWIPPFITYSSSIKIFPLSRRSHFHLCCTKFDNIVICVCTRGVAVGGSNFKSILLSRRVFYIEDFDNLRPLTQKELEI